MAHFLPRKGLECLDFDAKRPRFGPETPVFDRFPLIFRWFLVAVGSFLVASRSTELAARPAYETLAGLARQLDGTRLVAWASRHKERDVTLDLADVVAFNDYPGGGEEEK